MRINKLASLLVAGIERVCASDRGSVAVDESYMKRLGLLNLALST